MTTGFRGGANRSLFWVAAAAAMAVVVLTRLELTFDLSAFLPNRSTLANEILVEQLRNGPSSRLLVIGISGAQPAALADASDLMRDALASNPAFVSVLNGSLAAETGEIPPPIDRYYLLMQDVDYSPESLRAALQARLRDLAIGGGAAVRGLISRDPFLATADILGALVPVDITGELWFADNGSAVIIAETQSASIDIAAQQRAIEAVREEFGRLAGAAGLQLDITGVGAFSVELQETIRAEATRRSILASVALVFVLLLAFRKPVLVLLAALPLGMGFLAGLTTVCLLFDEVHGITLAFGFTMLGVAIDYPLHFFSHAQYDSGARAIARIWPTMRLGAISTVVAYLALVFAGSDGLSQLGLFTAAGVLCAVLVTRSWLPFLVADRAMPQLRAGAANPGSLSYVAGLLVLPLAVAVAWAASAPTGLWDDNLSSLSPVPVERLSADQALRSAAPTPDLRYQIVLYDESLETLLTQCERMIPLLAEAADDGLLAGSQAVCRVLPSRASQRQRQAAIPAETEIRSALQAATAGTPFREDAFEPFVVNALEAKSLGLLEPEDFRSTVLRSWLEAHLLELDSAWASLISVRSPNPSGLAERIPNWSVRAELVDLQSASAELMQSYRVSALEVTALAGGLILLLLWFARGDLRQILWVGLTVASALATTVAVTSLMHGGLTVVHLVALLLVVGLGLDYALFLSRKESDDERLRTHRGVLACAASTTLAFAILAGSSIPVLSYLGLTVATGSAASYLIAFVGSRRWRKVS